MTKIAVVGLGYVGLANALLLARNHDVIGLDTNASRVALLNDHLPPFADKEIEEHLQRPDIRFQATVDAQEALSSADFVIVSTPTDFDEMSHSFDTSSVESVIASAREICPTSVIVIKSTVPVGFTATMRARHQTERIVFSPEFLREGRALYDSLYPSRIVIGGYSDEGRAFGELLRSCSQKPDVTVHVTGPTEAEAIKLFSNTYLAMRVAFFNELDSFAMSRGLDSRQIIEGVSGDPRIGGHYNNPSFGYGGYCLPKDTKQLQANFTTVPQNMIAAIVDANRTRKDFLVDEIMARRPASVGIYRLVMKSGSDNFRQSSVLGLIRRLAKRGVRVIVHEPNLEAKDFLGHEVINDLAAFKAASGIILANRRSAELADVKSRVFTRDLFGAD